MQPSRRTFLKTAAASAGALWVHPTQAAAKYEVRVHFLGLFVALKHGGKSYIATLRGESGPHRPHVTYLAIHPSNYAAGSIGAPAYNEPKVRAFRISSESPSVKVELNGPRADDAVKPTYPKTSGSCPTTLCDWRDPRWHVKLEKIGKVHKPNWPAELAVDVKIEVESDAIEAEPPLIESVRKLTWKVGSVTQALTDRLLYVVKTDVPTFKIKDAALQLKAVGTEPIQVYVLTVPETWMPGDPYKIGDTLTHFDIGFPLLESRPHIPVADLTPKATGNCDDVAPDVVEPPVVTALYENLFSDVKLGPFLSRTVFCPGYGSYP